VSGIFLEVGIIHENLTLVYQPSKMQIDLSITPDQLNDAIQNTIRVFNNYRFIKKTDRDGRLIIQDSEWSGAYYYFITEDGSGSQLSVEAIKEGRPLTAKEKSDHEEAFIKNVLKIIEKEITLTPEIISIDIYKKKRRPPGMITIIYILIAVVLIIIGYKSCTKM
jgi:hypothetical protein